MGTLVQCRETKWRQTIDRRKVEKVFTVMAAQNHIKLICNRMWTQDDTAPLYHSLCLTLQPPSVFLTE